jgi:cysteine desulfurase
MKPRIYLDHAATTPVDPRVLRAMTPYFSTAYGNPGSLHGFGQDAMAAVDAARESIAHAIGADFREILFTASATEANNLALRGAVRAWRARHASVTTEGRRPRIVIGAIEHEAVHETAEALAREDAVEVVTVPVDAEGFIDPAAVAAALTDDTVIVSIMHGNNEVGTVEPIAAIADAIRAYRKGEPSRPWPLFHTDAAQTFSFLSCDVEALGVDMMTLSAHKMYGPKGIGALYIRGGSAATHPAPLVPIVTGGGQEFGLRSGTENVPLIVGFAKAATLAATLREKEAKRLTALREYSLRAIKKTVRSAAVNGPRKGRVLPHIVNVVIPGVRAEDLITWLDLAGIAVSSGSACRARAIAPSSVIRALGHSEARARESIRISMGRGTTEAHIDRLCGAMKLFFEKRRTIL